MNIILHLPQRIQEWDRRDYLREKELADIVQKRLESADIDNWIEFRKYLTIPSAEHGIHPRQNSTLDELLIIQQQMEQLLQKTRD